MTRSAIRVSFFRWNAEIITDVLWWYLSASQNCFAKLLRNLNFKFCWIIELEVWYPTYILRNSRYSLLWYFIVPFQVFCRSLWLVEMIVIKNMESIQVSKINFLRKPFPVWSESSQLVCCRRLNWNSLTRERISDWMQNGNNHRQTVSTYWRSKRLPSLTVKNFIGGDYCWNFYSDVQHSDAICSIKTLKSG